MNFMNYQPLWDFTRNKNRFRFFLFFIYDIFTLKVFKVLAHSQLKKIFDYFRNIFHIFVLSRRSNDLH